MPLRHQATKIARRKFLATGLGFIVGLFTLSSLKSIDKKKEDILGTGWVNYIVDGEKNQKRLNWENGVKYDKYIKDNYHIIHGKTKQIKHLEYSVTIKRNEDKKIIAIMGSIKELNT